MNQDISTCNGMPAIKGPLSKAQRLAQQPCQPAEDGVCEALDCPNHGQAAEPVADEKPAVSDFAHWLNRRRDLPVAEVFHDIVHYYRLAITQQTLTDEHVSDHVSGHECRRLLYGFMLDCNAVGLEQAGKNLLKGIKQSAHGITGSKT